MTQFENLINNIKNYKYKFIDNNFDRSIKKNIKELFPGLNDYDFDILFFTTKYLIEDISIRFGFKNEEKYYKQWTQNSGRDIKSTTLMLLPYINDKNNYKLFKKLSDLNQILCDVNDQTLSKEYLEMKRQDVLKEVFKYSNFSIGLINEKEDEILKLFNNDNEKLIYDIIHHNLVSLLETLSIVNGKLYINWINIQPLNLKNYKKSNLYKRTFSKLENLLGNLNNIGNFLKDYKGLYLGDYYNVFRIYYYQDIKKIKWVLYNKKVKTQTGEKRLYMIQYLNKILKLDSIFYYNNFNDLNFNDKSLFRKQLNIIFQKFKMKNKILYDYEFERSILLNLITYFCNNYKYKAIFDNDVFKKFIIKNYNDENIEIKNGEYVEKDENILENTTDEDIIRAFDEIISDKKNNNKNNKKIINDYDSSNIDHLWKYLKDTIVTLQNTMYGRKLIKNNKFNEYFFLENTNNKINLKNLYNIAKSLSHEEIGNSWKILPENYKSLNSNQIINFWNKLNTNISNWLKIKNNIKIQEGNSNLSDAKYNEIILNIGQNFLNKRVIDENDNNEDFYWNELVWKTLVMNGILSDFSVNLNLTDKNRLPLKDSKFKIWSELKNIINNNYSDYENSYYFLTNQKFKNTKINGNKNSDYEQIKYLDLITDKKARQLWYTFYAMDWISQINFFNRYINHQILYVTGSTGTGKSTQVPKLLLYALKMYEYKSKGKIICTQPRIGPTVNNTERISTEMGVPIKKSYKNFKNIKTNNYYLQYKHQNDNHTSDYNNNLQLRMVTDGTLLQEILNNPIMKEQIPIKKLNKKGKKESYYGKKNRWDILIVDEAHEHNVNMDVILTLSRQVCFYNNSVRLVIISATMDDDDPIYRSYFKKINDNLVYPIKRPIKHPILPNNNFLPYSYYMDRRFHISPPGQTTLYKIKEIYDEEIEKKFTNDEKINSIIAQEESYEKIKEICTISNTGQILLFLTGSNEIRKAVEILNKILPDEVVTLPYYANLNSEYKDIIEKIDVNVGFIKNKKENIHNEWSSKFISDKSVPDGIYKRAVIVATNVAEASITIPNLLFVVDNGYAKVNIYNENEDNSELIIEKISEASRLQRKGRVGRIADGSVYYLYGKDKRKNVLPKYKITQEDNKDLYLKLTANNSNNDIIFMPIVISPYYHHLLPNGFFRNINKRERLKNTVFFKNKIFENIKHQYLLDDKKIDNIYYQNNNIFKFDGKDDPYLRKDSGFDINLSFDLKGIFYIIHPLENLVKRNITNKIILFKDELRDDIKIESFRITLKRFENKLMLINIKADRIEKIVSDNNITLDSSVWKKSFLYDKINSLRTDTKFEITDCLQLIIAKGFGVLNEVIEIISLLKAIDYKIDNLALKSKRGYLNLKFFDLYGYQKSDLIGLHKIIKLFKSKFNYLKIFGIMQASSDIILKAKIEFNQRSDYFKKINLNNLKSKFEDYNIFKVIQNKGLLNNEYGFLIWLFDSDYISNYLSKEIINNNSKIKNWCLLNYIDYQSIINFLINYQKYTISVIASKRNYDSNIDELSSLDWVENISSSFKKSLSNNSIENKILRTFIVANPINNAVKININNYVYKLITTNDDTIPLEIGSGKPRFRNSDKINSLCSNLSSCLSYLKIKEINNYKYMSIITGTYPGELSKAIPFYFNRENFKLYYNLKDEDNNYRLIKVYGKNWEKIINEIENNWSIMNFVWQSPELPVISEYISNLKIRLIKN